MERLLACALLWHHGICDCSPYNERLDELFTQTPDNELLANLELNSSDSRKTYDLLAEWNEQEKPVLDDRLFGHTLLEALCEAYKTNPFTKQQFAYWGQRIWYWLPDSIQYDAPFVTLLDFNDVPFITGPGTPMPSTSPQTHFLSYNPRLL